MALALPIGGSSRSYRVLLVTATRSRQPLPPALPASIADRFSPRNIHILLLLQIALRTLTSGLLSPQTIFRGEQCTRGALLAPTKAGRGAARWWPTSPSSQWGGR